MNETRDFAKDLERVLETGPKASRPTVVSAAPMPTTRDTVTVGTLRDALAQLHENALRTRGQAAELAYRLAGGELPKDAGGAVNPVADDHRPVFQALAGQVMGLSQTLTAIDEQLKRIDAVLR